MELRQLRCFVKAAQCLNFTEAAKAVCVNQSSFSQSIKQLEEEVKVTLLHRNAHEIALTQAGHELLPYALRVLQQTDNCVNRMNDLLEMRCGTLNIGVTHSFNIVLSETLQEFLKAYPGIKVNIFYKTMSELMELLIKREVDFVLSYRPFGGEYPQVTSHTLFEDRLSVILPANHELAKRESVKLADLAKYPMALPSEGLHAREVLKRILSKTDVKLDVRVQLDQVSPLLGLVRSGMLITVLSGTTVELENDLVAIPIDAEGNRMEGSCQMLKEDYRKEAAKEFVHILSETSVVRNMISGWFK